MVTEYRAGLGSRLFLFVVFSGLVGLGVGLLLPDALPHSLGFNQRRMISWVVIAIAVVLIGYITFVHLAVKVRVGPQGVEVFRGPRRAYVFPPGTRYRVEIVHQRYNGVKAGTVRNLIADPSGRAKRITIPKISREKFNELYQRLEPLQVPNAMPAPAVPAMPPPSGSAASFAAPPAPSAPAAPAPASFAPRSQWAGGKRGVPERVDVLPGSVVLDGEQVRFDSLTSLEISPPQYRKHTMTLRGSGGKARVIKLGTAAGGDSAPIGADYASFITALVRASGGSGLVRFDWE